MKKYSLLLLISVHAIFAGKGSFDVKASLPLSNKAYPFGILRAEYAHLFSSGIYFYSVFDTEALFVRASQSSGKWFYGVDVSGHLVDWQNLEFIVDREGNLRKEISIKAAEGKGEIFFGIKSKAHFLKLSTGYEVAKLSPREGDTSLSTSGQWAWLSAFLGKWKTIFFVPGFKLEDLYILGVQSRWTQKKYVLWWQQYPISISGTNDIAMVGRFGHFWKMKTITMNVSAQTGLSNLAAPGEVRDLTFYFSQGGPEKPYRRLAGFAFSEYRAPIYGLVNSDIYWKLAGSFYLWAVVDFLAVDANATGSNQWEDNIHSGVGVGSIFRLKSFSIYERIDFALTAKRKGSERLQVFVGLSGVF
ncbi:MAG: hypothetical protein D6767_07410 [Candidatus Hydrogenedentota bacterium]|nr:MAG: hypothetical protein D6767_07410 [Candidatus Hydrogenedentota bacterium]